MTQKTNKKRLNKSPEEIALINMMDNMADGKYDSMWAIKIRKAIRTGSNINIVDKNGETPLILAIKMHNYFIVDELLQAGAKTDVVDKKGHSVMWHAINEKNYAQDNIINSLLRFNALIDVASITQASEKDEKMAIKLINASTHLYFNDYDRLKIQEITEKIMTGNDLKDEDEINNIFELSEQGILNEDKAVSMLIEGKPIHIAKKESRKLGHDDSKQRN